MTRAPIRIQRSRAKGWKIPEGAVYVGRPTKWGNHYKVDAHTTAADAARLFELAIMSDRAAAWRAEVRKDLRGKDLCCWCPLTCACHADVLLRIANA
jgi:hypothetical protein